MYKMELEILPDEGGIYTSVARGENLLKLKDSFERVLLSAVEPRNKKGNMEVDITFSKNGCYVDHDIVCVFVTPDYKVQVLY